MFKGGLVRKRRGWGGGVDSLYPNAYYVLHNFIQQSMDWVSAVVQILLAVWQCFAMVRNSDNGPSPIGQHSSKAIFNMNLIKSVGLKYEIILE